MPRGLPIFSDSVIRPRAGRGVGVPSAVPRKSEAKQVVPATPRSEPRSLRLPRCSCAGKDTGGSERADGRARLRPEAAVRGARQRGLRTRLDRRRPARLVAPTANAKYRELAAARAGGSGRAVGAGRARRGGAGLALTDRRAAGGAPAARAECGERGERGSGRGPWPRREARRPQPHPYPGVQLERTARRSHLVLGLGLACRSSSWKRCLHSRMV